MSALFCETSNGETDSQTADSTLCYIIRIVPLVSQQRFKSIMDIA